MILRAMNLKTTSKDATKIIEKDMKFTFMERLFLLFCGSLHLTVIPEDQWHDYIMKNINKGECNDDG